MDELEKTTQDSFDASANLFKALLEQATVTARAKGHMVSGMDAVYVLFADRFGWTPAQVRGLDHHELSILMDAFFPAKGARIKSGS